MYNLDQIVAKLRIYEVSNMFSSSILESQNNLFGISPRMIIMASPAVLTLLYIHYRFKAVKKTMKPLSGEVQKALAKHAEEKSKPLESRPTTPIGTPTLLKELEGGSYEKLENDQLVSFGVGRKIAFSGTAISRLFKKLNWEIYHSCVFIDRNGTGRQSPCLSFDENISKSVAFNEMHKTVAANEKYFSMPGDIADPNGIAFYTKDTLVKFYGNEMRYMISTANKIICEQQTCNMVTSNCYSFTTTVVALGIQTLDDRDPSLGNQIRNVALTYKTLRELTLDMHGVGIACNRTVELEITKACAVVQKYGLFSSPEAGRQISLMQQQEAEAEAAAKRESNKARRTIIALD